MNLFQRYLVEEFKEDYEEGHLTRREALRLIAGVTGSTLMAATILSSCLPAAVTETPALLDTGDTPTPDSLPVASTETAAATPTPGETAAPTGAAANIKAAEVEFPAEDTNILGYLAHPAGEEPRPVILVCHENRGLTAHIQDVTRRLAAAGYAALAVDLLSRHGGTASLDRDDVPGVLGNISPEQFVQDFISGWRYMQGQPFALSDRVGMVGFCFGGGVTWLMATRMPELLAAVPFYGPHPPVAEVPNIQAAVLAIYAESDMRINQGIRAIEAAMQEHNKIYEKVIYPGTDHAFHNDTGPRYNAQAAQDAWRRTLEWFGRYVNPS